MGSYRKTRAALAGMGKALCASLVLVTGLGAQGMAVAQQTAAGGSPFAPVLRINDSVITRYELDQRVRFLTLLRAPGDPEKEALKALTQDRLAGAEAKRVGLRLTAQQVTDGMTEFAGRANLTAEQFIEALGQGGVSPESFRDFAANGLIWRELVRARFLPTVSVTEAEIDRAIAAGVARPNVQLLLSELVIPVEGDPSDEMALARKLKAGITSEESFAEAARSYSASPSAARGGRLDWTSSSALPPALIGVALALAPGQVSDPVALPNGVALFQLRDLREDTTAAPPKPVVEYAEYLLANTEGVLAEAAALANRIDSCKDLYAEARGLPEDRLTVTTRPVAEVPQDVALQLAQLDQGESSTAIVRGGWRVFLMLCGRAPSLENPLDRGAISEQLKSQKLTLLSEVYLEELRSEAIITTP